ncbi:hypothetical protein CR161_07250 [Prosthecochloris sp. ZM]|nr:hypothetical protein [Prosthecochloris sp.]RDD30527.1 hypothetical protein CR161_07250 [Prosthecochloris sp. ZM]
MLVVVTDGKNCNKRLIYNIFQDKTTALRASSSQKTQLKQNRLQASRNRQQKRIHQFFIAFRKALAKAL